GFVIAPPSLRRAVRTAKFVTDWHTTLPAQAALARFIDEGYLARHVRKMRQVYQVRHRLLSTGLRDLLGDRLEVLPSAAGRHPVRQQVGVDPLQVRSWVDAKLVG